MKKQRQQPAAMTASGWNSLYRIGQPVVVRMDNGTEWHTRTRSEAWELGHGQAVVMLEGRSGGFDLARVTARATNDPQQVAQ